VGWKLQFWPNIEPSRTLAPTPSLISAKNEWQDPWCILPGQISTGSVYYVVLKRQNPKFDHIFNLGVLGQDGRFDAVNCMRDTAVSNCLVYGTTSAAQFLLWPKLPGLFSGSFVRSLRAEVQPTLDPSAESSALAQGEEGNW